MERPFTRLIPSAKRQRPNFLQLDFGRIRDHICQEVAIPIKFTCEGGVTRTARGVARGESCGFVTRHGRAAATAFGINYRAQHVASAEQSIGF